MNTRKRFPEEISFVLFVNFVVFVCASITYPQPSEKPAARAEF